MPNDHTIRRMIEAALSRTAGIRRSRVSCCIPIGSRADAQEWPSAVEGGEWVARLRIECRQVGLRIDAGPTLQYEAWYDVRTGDAAR